MPSRRHVITALGAATALACATLGLASTTHAAPAGTAAPHRLAAAGTATTASVVDVVAVGDIACPPGRETTPSQCHQADTAALAARLTPDAVLALGDLQYEDGSLDGFRASYDKTWGALFDLTHPVPGNHEYRTQGASGYFTYFEGRQPGAPGYYARNLGSWRVYLLNSNCDRIDCAAEYAWLVDDLQKRPRACSLFAMHHPRWSSGQHGSNPSMRRFFRIAYRHRVEMIVSGHDHHYERFRPKNARGQRVSNGVVQFVSGAGGKNLYPLKATVPGSAYRKADTFGVLRLRLGETRYRWAWKGIDGSTPDSGSRACV